MKKIRSVPHAISAPVHPPKAVVSASSTFSLTEDLKIGVRNLAGKGYKISELENLYIYSKCELLHMTFQTQAELMKMLSRIYFSAEL